MRTTGWTAERRAGRTALGLLGLVAALALMAGCAGDKKPALTEEEIRQKTYAQLPAQPDEILISGETITCEDVMTPAMDDDATGPTLKERLEARAKEVSLEQFLVEATPLMRQRLNRNIVTRIVLSKRARRDLGEKSDERLDELAEQDLRRFVLEEHGGNAAEADAALQRRGMNRVTYKERWKKTFLTEYVIRSKSGRTRPVTYGEIVAKYDQIKDQEFLQEGVLQFRLIDIQVDKVTLTDANDNPVVKARELAAELLKKVAAGEDFAELAKRYSHDHRAAEGGLWRPRDPASLAAPYDALAMKALNMEVGQVAGPIEELSHVFIMKLEEKRDPGYKPLAEVQDQVREVVQRERRSAALAELNEEIKQQVAAADTTQFIEYCLERLYRLAH